MAAYAKQTDRTPVAGGIKRRGLMAGAAALMAGMMAREIADSPFVGATHQPEDVGLGISNTASTTTTVRSNAPYTTTGAALLGLRHTTTIDITPSYRVGVYGHSGSTTAAVGVFGEAGGSTNGIGVQGFGDGTGAGVFGLSYAGPGIYGKGQTDIGVLGEADTIFNTPNAVAVRGQILTPINATSTIAVDGLNQSSGTGGIGVRGVCVSGIGVLGQSTASIGVYGANTGGGATPYGVVGAISSAPGFALYGVATIAGTVGFAAGASVAGAIAGQFAGNVNFFGNGAAGNTVTLNGANLVVANGGTKNAAVRVADGSYGLLHCVEAPEPWFEDFGEGTLVGGKAEVKLEANFAATVDTTTLHVFLTPHDANHHLAVTMRTTSGFAVTAGVSAEAVAKGTKTTDLHGAFTYRVVAKRKDVKGDRFAPFVLPKEIKLAPPPIPKFTT